MKLCRNWSGEDLKGEWLITLKVDGVRATITENGAISRGKHRLYNLEGHWHGVDRDVEVFTGDFGSSMSACRTKRKHRCKPIPAEHLYDLDPIDPRLVAGVVVDPTAEQIKAHMRAVVDAGGEGIVLRQGDTWLKVKPIETFDVVITGLQEGRGKHKGMLGAFKTTMGRVGTGFTDRMRREFFDVGLIGKTVEVRCMQLTNDGLFRHPAFVRMRFDK